MVDSGADGTLLTRSTASDLGLDLNTDLVPTPQGSGGAGGTSFPTWETSQVITGQIVHIPTNGTPALWGPVIAFQPVFADGQHALFGRRDFFAHFAISFEHDPSLGPVFHVDH